MEYYRGDMFFVTRRGDDSIGAEMRSGRPAIIVSNDISNKFSDVVEVVFLTSREKKELPTHVQVVGKVLSTALCEQINTVSKARLGNFIRSCTDEEMANIDKALMESLGCSPVVEEAPRDEASIKPAEFKDSPMETIATLTAERNTYKELYEKLLGKLVS